MHLLVMRHAQAEAHAPDGTDHARSLTPGGRRAAEAMGAWLARVGQIPDLVLTSSAARAQQTAACMRAGGVWDARVVIEDAFYGTTPEAVVARVGNTDDVCSSLLVVGHEPVWSALVALLCGGGYVHMPTATVAIVEPLVPRWRDLCLGKGRLVGLLTPGLLARES